MGIKDEIARIVAGKASQLLLPAPKAAKEGIKVFHASPHRFDRFSNHNAFGGEGFQMYGPGNYFSDSPAISGERGHYWDQFDDYLKIKQTPLDVGLLQHDILPHIQDRYLEEARHGFTNEKEVDTLIKDILISMGVDGSLNNPKNFNMFKDMVVNGDKFKPKDIDNYFKFIGAEYNKEAAKQVGKEPYTYEALIHANKDDLLDQDYNLRTQPHMYDKLKDLETWAPRIDEKKLTDAFLNETDLSTYDAQDLLSNFIREYTTGGASVQNTADQLKAVAHYNAKGGDTQDMFNEIDSLANLAQRRDLKSNTFQPYDKGGKVIADLVDIAKNDKSLDFEALMKDLDIPGTRYLAGGSRSGRKAKPDYNYTIWDPSKINIMKRYAIPGAIGAGALAAQSDPSNAGESWSPDEVPAKVDKLLKSYVEPKGELRSYTPTAQENVANWIAANTTLPIQKADDYTWLAEWIPPVAAAMEGYNAQKYRNEGDFSNATWSTLFSALNALPGGKK